MTVRESSGYEHLAHARTCIANALRTWDGASLDRMRSCVAILEGVIADLHATEAWLRANSALAHVGMAATAQQLQREAAVLLRLVDAGASFYRGWALRLDRAAPTYRPSGLADHLADVVSPSGIQA